MHLIDKGVIEEYEFHVPYAEDPSGVITYYTRAAAKAGGVDRLSGAFATLAPMVRDYLKDARLRAPGRAGRQGHPAPPGRERRPGARRRRVRRGDPRAGDHRARADDHRERLPGVRDPAVPLVARRPSRAEHTVFNLTPVDTLAGGAVRAFLDRATDVAAWAKLTMNSRFALEYISKAGALRYYYPDFVVRLTDDSCLIVETKGQEDLDVPSKTGARDAGARTQPRLAGRDWAYEKVRQKMFDAYTGETSTACGASSLRQQGAGDEAAREYRPSLVGR